MKFLKMVFRNKLPAFILILSCIGISNASPIDNFSVLYSSHIGKSETPTTISLSTHTVRKFDLLRYVTITSSHTASNLTIYDGINDDSAGAIVVDLNGDRAGTYTFDLKLSSGATISKSGSASMNLIFYLRHPVGN